MKIVVSNSYEGSIYEQIKRQILHAVLSFELLLGDMLPSLRSLAKDLKVGVLTINKAYTELESEGYIENIQGKGCFVANKSSDLILELSRQVQQLIKKDFMRCFPTQAFVRSEIEFIDEGYNIAVRRQRNIKRFWQILPEQSIGIFIRASLPGGMWIGKVKRQTIERSCYRTVLGKFFAAVRSDGSALFLR